MVRIILFAILGISFYHTIAQDKTSPKNQRIELGKVSWYRDYYVALQAAKSEGKAVLILFQEVPGCATCQYYGKEVLGHPMMVEVIQNEFIPLAIYNNKGGHDAEILERYREPSWNNPVVRIVDQNGSNLVNRVGGNYTPMGLYSAMQDALIKQNKAIPEYMTLLQSELVLSGNRGLKTDYFKMYCFWTGEKRLGEANGVLKTETGFIGGNEVVKVKYDPSLLNEDQLASFAKKSNCAPVSSAESFRVSEKDHYFQLRHTNYKYLPLTTVQKTKINSALGNQQPAEKYLSPTQKDWLAQLDNPKTKRRELVEIPFRRAWEIKTE
jgi:hypothetical protein